METIKEYLSGNTTLKAMLLSKDNSQNKKGALEQIKLDTGHSLEFVYENYFNILNFLKQ